ncbi:hypothetical protein JK229_03370 [Pantoea dispersa]|uniref:hypothetical protein n=1 Tax=Pantoea dispersa TaxID=59814 RepID=UPI001BADC8BF|nr:hypothetical protein [Pantoea dispersa]MBS0904162.1 hypothetical protein [Pantoea dispersa]
MSKTTALLDNLLKYSPLVTNIVTIIVAMVVGTWAIFSTISVRKEGQIAEYKLRELEQRTQQLPHVAARVEILTEKNVNQDQIIKIKVVLTNSGNKESRIQLDNESLTLVPVSFNKGEPVYNEPINLINGRYRGAAKRYIMNWIDIGAGESYTLNFVHSINQSGTYLVHFLAFNDTQPNNKLKNDIFSFQYAVGEDKYFTIE